MSREVCFIDDDGMVATCVNEVEGDCHRCNHNPEDHFDWLAKENAKGTKMTSIRNLKTEREKMDAFIGTLEEAYLRGHSVAIVLPDCKLTIDWSAIPDVHLLMVGENKKSEVSHVALAYARAKRRVPFEYQSLTEEEYFQMLRGWREAKQRNREARYERNERSFFGFEDVHMHNSSRYKRMYERNKHGKR